MNSKRFKILFISVAVIFIAYIISVTYSKFSTTATGEGELAVAKWHILIKKDLDSEGIDISSEGEHDISTEIKMEPENNPNVVKGKIAPRSKFTGSFYIDPCDTEIRLKYIISISDAIYGGATSAPDLELESVLINDTQVELEGNSYTGILDIDEEETIREPIKVTLNGVWVPKERDNSTGIELGSLALPINILVEQYNTIEAKLNNAGKILVEASRDSFIKNYEISGAITRLPEIYQELGYIESTGTQWIDTEYKVQSDYAKIEGEIEFTSFTNNVANNFILPFGSYDNKCSLNIYLDKSNGTSTNSGIEAGNTYGVTISTGKMYLNTPIKFSIEANNGLINGYSNGTNLTNKSYSNSLNTAHSLGLFASRNTGTAYAFCQMKCYKFNCYSKSGLEKEFIPCYRKIDGETGMYDTVSKSFYTNKGANKFIKGNIVFDELGNYVTDGENIGKYAIPIKVDNEKDGLKTYNIYIDEPLRTIGDVSDTIKSSGNELIRKIGKIDSYNGENITTQYISSTGSLDIGAAVLYVLNTPITESIDELPSIELNQGTNEITMGTNRRPYIFKIEY